MREVLDGIGCAVPQTRAAVLRLKRRPDFLLASKGERFHSRAFSLQLAPLAGDIAQPGAPARFGFTVTKRIGGAVERNRIRRRLKEALRLTQDLPARPGRDYVIVAKAEALTRDFQALQADLTSAVQKIHRPARPKSVAAGTGTPRPKAPKGRS